MLQRAVSVLILALTIGCGGATELGGSSDADASGGAGGTAAGGAGGTSGGSGPTTAGTTGGSGPTTAGTTGGTSAGGNASANASATNTTGLNCGKIECGGLPCPDGRWVTLPGDCCPVCVCDQVECEPLDCPSGETVTPLGSCCAECAAPLLCEGVMCDAPTECPTGYSYERPDGACCAACLPDDPANVACPEIECPDDKTCAAGYTRGDLVGGCCHQCLPDPLYCDDNTDCVIADRPRPCCGCPEVMSTRALDDDPCWSNVDEPRSIPDECYPDQYCDALCGACPDRGQIECVQNRCVEVPLEP